MRERLSPRSRIWSLLVLLLFLYPLPSRAQFCVEGASRSGAPARQHQCGKSTSLQKQPPVLTVADQTIGIHSTGFTVIPSNGAAITVLPGVPVTIGTDVVSLGPTGIVLGSSTIPIPFTDDSSAAASAVRPSLGTNRSGHGPSTGSSASTTLSLVLNDPRKSDHGPRPASTSSRTFPGSSPPPNGTLKPTSNSSGDILPVPSPDGISGTIPHNTIVSRPSPPPGRISEASSLRIPVLPAQPSRPGTDRAPPPTVIPRPSPSLPFNASKQSGVPSAPTLPIQPEQGSLSSVPLIATPSRPTPPPSEVSNPLPSKSDRTDHTPPVPVPPRPSPANTSNDNKPEQQGHATVLPGPLPGPPPGNSKTPGHQIVSPGPPPRPAPENNTKPGQQRHTTVLPGPLPGPSPGNNDKPGHQGHITVAPGPPPGPPTNSNNNNNNNNDNNNNDNNNNNNNKTDSDDDNHDDEDGDNHNKNSEVNPPATGLPPRPSQTDLTTTASESCESKVRAPRCTEVISEFQTSGMTKTSTTTRTTCSTITKCDAHPSTITTSITNTNTNVTLGPTAIPENPWGNDKDWFQHQQAFLVALSSTHASDATYSAASTSSLSTATPSTRVRPGQAIAPGIELRILPLGDSITYGWLSGDGNGYRLELLKRLNADRVVFAGTETSGNMEDNWMAGWPGKQISFISQHAEPSLAQGPNVILLHAGTNDLASEGSSPDASAQRLGDLIDQIIKARPQAVILVAQLIHADDHEAAPGHDSRIMAFDNLVPGIVKARAENGSHALTVDFRSITASLLRPKDVHPSDEGYRRMGDIWYDAMRTIPKGWIQHPDGPDPVRQPHSDIDITANGGPDPAIPLPNPGPNRVQPSNDQQLEDAWVEVIMGGPTCKGEPIWKAVGKIALGIGHSGDWRFKKNWVSGGKVAEGLHLKPTSGIRLVDMDGDGKADYLWVNPKTGELTCWLNHLPGAWSPAGTNKGDRVGIIASGAGHGDQVFFADMNGDKKSDYLVVNGQTGAVTIYWNGGPDASADNGWRFIPGGVIASGVPHANLATLRFPDINGDGRADYVIVGKGGSLGLWLNIGQPGSHDVAFEAQGGIASGATSNFSNLLLEDIDGDGRSDYLLWDDKGGLTGFLNIRTRSEGVNYFANQGDTKTIADGIGQHPSVLRLADLDGDGRKDYCYLDESGAIWVWWNRGSADTSLTMDGVHFADVDGDGDDDYVWVDPISGAPTVYLNKGPMAEAPLGYQWSPPNPSVIASGAGPGSLVQWADITGDGKDDYLIVDAITGAVDLYINGGSASTADNNWRFSPFGRIATGLGPGKNVRFADIDGDGRDDYIYLGPHGETTVYRNQYSPESKDTEFIELPSVGASGIGQRPEDISFHDIDGNGRADYVYTRATDGAMFVWKNNYPEVPMWVPPSGPSHEGLGVSGHTIKYASLTRTGRPDYIAMDPNTGALAAWLNSCDGTTPTPCKTSVDHSGSAIFYYWTINDKWMSDGILSKDHWERHYMERMENWIGGPPSYISAYPPVLDDTSPGFFVNGTQWNGDTECGQKWLTFSRTCDGNFNVVGDTGGIAHCTRDGLPLAVPEEFGRVVPRLVCTGAICL